MYRNIIFQGQSSAERKRAYTDVLQSKVPAQSAKKPRQQRVKSWLSKAKGSKICFYQEACRCPPGESCFQHLPKKMLAGTKGPYKLCYEYPQCAKKQCPFVHWTGDDEDIDIGSYEKPPMGLPPLNSKSNGGIIPRPDGEDKPDAEDHAPWR